MQVGKTTLAQICARVYTVRVSGHAALERRVDTFSPARPSSSFLGPPGLFPPSSSTNPGVDQLGPGGNSSTSDTPGSTVTYHGVCLTVWSHADAQRGTAIRHTLEAGRSCKESAQSCCHVPQGPMSRHPRPNIPSASQPQAQWAWTVGG